MPQDYRPIGPSQSAIGFRELRQACEISTLKEELERLRHEAQGLRRVVDETVDKVRARFQALTPAEMTDAEAMLPLLQFAVTQLIAVRDRSHGLDLGADIVSDEGRVGAPVSPPAPVREARPNPEPARPPKAIEPPVPAPVIAPPPPPPPPRVAAPPPPPPVAGPARREAASSAVVDWLAPRSR